MVKIFKLLHRISSLLFLSLILTHSCIAQNGKNAALINGNWFDGTNFKAKTMYSINGIFSRGDLVSATAD